jgi:uncharacterized membrane protein YozB (DUF420 family)
MTVADLPVVNASLNGLSAVLLGLGYYFVKRDRLIAHRNCMIAACVCSAVFLGCYITYHVWMHHMYGTAHTTFAKPEWFRPIYLTILVTHLTLAVAIVPMILITLSRALRNRFDQHKRIARWTWPLWMYVSVTGVIIYLLLYQIFPQR